MWCFEIVSVVAIGFQIDALAYNEYTTCMDILVCDLWTVRQDIILEHVPSLSLYPYFFHQWVIPTFPEI